MLKILRKNLMLSAKGIIKMVFNWTGEDMTPWPPGSDTDCGILRNQFLLVTLPNW